MDYEWVWWGVTVGLLGHVLYQVHQLRADVRWLTHRLGTWYGRGILDNDPRRSRSQG